MVPIPHHPLASGFEKVSPLILVVGLLSVLATIELYHQFLTWTDEVDEIRSNRVLSRKLVTRYWPVLEKSPHELRDAVEFRYMQSNEANQKNAPSLRESRGLRYPHKFHWTNGLVGAKSAEWKAPSPRCGEGERRSISAFSCS